MLQSFRGTVDEFGIRTLRLERDEERGRPLDEGVERRELVERLASARRRADGLESERAQANASPPPFLFAGTIA